MEVHRSGLLGHWPVYLFVSARSIGRATVGMNLNGFVDGPWGVGTCIGECSVENRPSSETSPDPSSRFYTCSKQALYRSDMYRLAA